MGAFWVTWPYWGRMCFFLALSILVVFIGGLCKMRYSKRKEERFLAIAERERAQEQVYGPHDIDKMRRDKVPFGIRALEDNPGSYVDGVWDATSMIASLEPLVVRPGGDHSSSNSQTSFHLPAPLKFNRDAFESRSSLSLNRESTAFERLVIEAEEEEDSPENKFKLPMIQRNSLTLDALEGVGSMSGPSTRQPLDVAKDSEPDRESDSSDRLPKQTDHYVPRRPVVGRSHTTSDALATRRPSGIDLLPFTETGDLAGLHKHRLSHAAETGQLLPRVRRRDVSSDYTPSAAPFGASTQKDGGESTNQQSSRSGHQSPIAADLTEPAAVPAVVPFQDFVESHPIPPQEAANKPRSSGESVRPVDTADPPLSSNPNFNGHSHRNSATRIVNSGFEVYPAGTFGSVGEPSDWNIDVEGGEKKEIRKLKKKRRSSSVFQEDMT